MYRVDNLELAKTKEDEEGSPIPHPDRLQLSAEHVAMNGAYLLDAGDSLLLFLGKVLQPFFCEKVRHCTSPLRGHIVELWLFRCLESANLWMLTRT